jgi:hypothetical protein
MPLSLTGGLHDVNGEFGAEHSTQPTGNAALRVAHLGRVVAFGVEEVGHFENVARAIGDTQLAALAAFEDEVDFAVRNYDAVLIKGFTPEFHGFSLLI